MAGGGGQVWANIVVSSARGFEALVKGIKEGTPQERGGADGSGHLDSCRDHRLQVSPSPLLLDGSLNSLLIVL